MGSRRSFWASGDDFRTQKRVLGRLKFWRWPKKKLCSFDPMTSVFWESSVDSRYLKVNIWMDISQISVLRQQGSRFEVCKSLHIPYSSKHAPAQSTWLTDPKKTPRSSRNQHFMFWTLELKRNVWSFKQNSVILYFYNYGVSDATKLVKCLETYK